MMQSVPLRGHDEGSIYPTEAIDCDWTLDGLHGFPAPERALALTGSPRGFCYYRDRWYIVQGNTLYSWTGSGEPTTLASGIPGTDRAHFVPLTEHLVVRVADRIYLVVGDSATQVSSVAPPSMPTVARVPYTAPLDVDHGGSATYSVSGNTMTLDDVADGEPGAHRFVGSSGLSNAPREVGAIALGLQSWQQTISLNHPISVEVWEQINSPANRKAVPFTLTEIPYPYAVGTVWIRTGDRIPITPSTGVRFHIRHSTTWLRSMTLYNTHSPRFYALTRVVGGVESEPLYIDALSVGTGLTEYWFTQFSGLPSGTWRLYRRDSAGVYRLVHEGTGSTYLDLKTDAELGMPLEINRAPTQGSYAIGWNRRCVVAQGSRLYISEAGRYKYGDDSEIVDVDDTIIGLAVIRGLLCYATRHGWYSLIGWRETLTSQRVYAEPPVVGFVGDALGLQRGALMLGAAIDPRVQQPLAKTLHTGARDYWLATNGYCYIRAQNKWTRLSVSVYDLYVLAGVLWLQRSDGLYRCTGEPSTAKLTMTILHDAPATLYQAVLDGYGDGVLVVTDRAGSPREVYGQLPLRLDRVETDYYRLPVYIGGKAIARLLIRLDPRGQLERAP